MIICVSLMLQLVSRSLPLTGVQMVTELEVVVEIEFLKCQYNVHALS